MKKLLYLSFIVLGGLSSACTSMLDVESKTSITSNYLYSTPDGLSRAVVGLYVKDRSFATTDAVEYCIQMLDYSTDIMVFRGGTAAAFARLDNLTPASGNIQTIWNQHYQIIGKANEIITAAEGMDMNNPEVKQAWAEAKAFRGRAYFELWKRFERLYLNLEPTTIDNADNREYKPATQEKLFEVIKKDLDDAIEVLPWVPDGTDISLNYGRWTKAAIKHVRAQVAMWEEDWNTAIEQCEDVFECPDYGMMDRAIDVFTGADLRCKEVLYAYQMSGNLGGGNTTSSGVVNGHKVSLITTPNYKKISGLQNCLEYGGYGWGRVYPNTYLFSLYKDKTSGEIKDKRYTELFRHKYYYNIPDLVPAGKELGDEVEVPNKYTPYLESLHPSSLKFFDKWTNTENPDRMSSLKDLILYRLAETYLMCSEAYFRKEGGNSSKAIEYYNKTYYRNGNTGNDYFNGPLTEQDLLDEYARELHFEGVRWPLLKRWGILYDQVKAHAGDTRADDPKLDKDYAQARTNFRPERDTRWPIPQAELSLVPGYGQNDGWF